MILSSDLGPDDRARHSLFMASPALWPRWPFLPVIRSTGHGHDLGLLLDARGRFDLTGYSATVFLTHLYALPPTLEGFFALPREVFDNADEVFDGGWRVD